MLALVSSWNMHLELMDVKTTFLHYNLDEKIYKDMLEYLNNTRHGWLVSKFNRSLYGLKKSSKQWYKFYDSNMF